MTNICMEKLTQQLDEQTVLFHCHSDSQSQLFNKQSKNYTLIQYDLNVFGCNLRCCYNLSKIGKSKFWTIGHAMLISNNILCIHEK